jgi:predicted dehydrogenase
MDMAMRIGIVGAGNIGQVHAKAALGAGSSVVAICDVDRDKAEALAATCPEAKALHSVDDLLSRDDVDGIVIAVPNHAHMEVALEVLQGGRDVLLEKPMAMSVEECERIVGAIRDSDRLLQMGFVCRFAPAAVAARKLIEEGALGEIYHAKAFMYRRRGIPGLGKWFTTKSKSGGGALIDIGVHFIDLALHLAGYPRPQRVSAQCVSRFGSPIGEYRFAEMWAGPPNPDGVFDVDDGVSALVRCEGNLTFELNVTWATNLPENVMPEGLVLLGDRGGCYLNLWENQLVLTTPDGDPLKDTQIPLTTAPDDDAWDCAWRGEHEYFSRVIRDRTPPHPSAANGLTVQRIIEAMYASSEAQREVEIA